MTARKRLQCFTGNRYIARHQGTASDREPLAAGFFVTQILFNATLPDYPFARRRDQGHSLPAKLAVVVFFVRPRADG
jgi:hypothetical protein